METMDISILIGTFSAGILTCGLAALVALRFRGDGQGDPAEQTRRALLESVAQNVSEVHHVYQQFLALALEFSRQGNSWPAHRKQELRRTTDELVKVFRNLTEAEATLLLLGEKKLERALRIYGAKIVHLRRQIYAEKDSFTGDDIHGIDQVRQDIAELRETFYDALSSRFKLA
ncbi:MAG: hypothetical protein LAT62_02760 [Natronospirillum sp.]|uniref:hypothetical protein n=1 Tax=Natronospirillum sp. TaxID=2812955 RepID=UPI0025E46414|nr:hypothetical protein [Natronospirillum sp.]MCH8550828.1 hypothetical protein [Natronospirillum sp.]